MWFASVRMKSPPHRQGPVGNKGQAGSQGPENPSCPLSSFSSVGWAVGGGVGEDGDWGCPSQWGAVGP